MKYREWLENGIGIFFSLQQWLAVASLFLVCVLGEMSESRAKRVRIKEVDGWTLRMLIDYVYTAEIQVTEENVQVRVNPSYHLALCTCHFFFLNQKSIPAPQDTFCTKVMEFIVKTEFLRNIWNDYIFLMMFLISVSFIFESLKFESVSSLNDTCL